MWIILSFTACLVSAPAQCQERELAYSAETVTVAQCQTRAVAMLARWATQHPRWRIAGSFSCSTAREREMKA